MPFDRKIWWPGYYRKNRRKILTAARERIKLWREENLERARATNRKCTKTWAKKNRLAIKVARTLRIPIAEARKQLRFDDQNTPGGKHV